MLQYVNRKVMGSMAQHAAGSTTTVRMPSGNKVSDAGKESVLFSTFTVPTRIENTPQLLSWLRSEAAAKAYPKGVNVRNPKLTDGVIEFSFRDNYKPAKLADAIEQTYLTPHSEPVPMAEPVGASEAVEAGKAGKKSR